MGLPTTRFPPIAGQVEVGGWNNGAKWAGGSAAPMSGQPQRPGLGGRRMAMSGGIELGRRNPVLPIPHTYRRRLPFSLSDRRPNAGAPNPHIRSQTGAKRRGGLTVVRKLKWPRQRVQERGLGR